MSTKDLPQRDLHQGITMIINWITQLQLSHTSTQEGRHKAKHKAKKKLQLGDHLDHKQELGDPMITNKIPLTI